MNLNALEKIFEQGNTPVLATLIIVTFIVIVYLYKELKNERGDRLKDMKDVWQEDLKFREEIKQLIQNIFDIIRNGTK